MTLQEIETMKSQYEDMLLYPKLLGRENMKVLIHTIAELKQISDRLKC